MIFSYLPLEVLCMSIVDKTIQSHQKIIPIIPAIDHHVLKNYIPLPSFRVIQNPFRQVQKTPYCYATMIFLGDKYVPSALVLAESLKRVGVKQNVVCFVQGVSDKVKRDLFRVFDYVIECELLEVKGYKEPKEFHFTKKKHYDQICKYVTKLNILGFERYSKIFYLDASTMVDENLDDIFERYSKSVFVEDAEFRRTKVGLRGTFFMITPSSFYFKKAIYLIQNYSTIFKNDYFLRGVDEVILFYTIYPNWSKEMLQNDIACNGNRKENPKDCRIYYFQVFKPFEPVLDKSPDEMKVYYQNYQQWDLIVKSLLELHPPLRIYFQKISSFRDTLFF
jgi:hypothetical protein